MSPRSGLTPDELASWRSFVEMHHVLERHLGAHLHRDFGLSNADFEILVNLSDAPGGRLRAVDLGRATLWEKSRLSHHLNRMAGRGLVRRAAVGDRHVEWVLTDEGHAAIAAVAPANAARVREFFVDVVGAQRLAALGELSREVLAAIDDHTAQRCTLTRR